jgi:hypothetical protein
MSSQPPPPTGAPLSRYDPPRVMAPTILDFWRSDVRRQPGRRAPRWIGWVAFALGILAMLTLFTGAVTSTALLVDISLGLSLTAGFFALVALIAGVGRVAGFFGLLFALAGNVFVIGWLSRLFA